MGYVIILDGISWSRSSSVGRLPVFSRETEVYEGELPVLCDMVLFAESNYTIMSSYPIKLLLPEDPTGKKRPI